jgi:tetratricopeptide (TPR) repeat protein
MTNDAGGSTPTGTWAPRLPRRPLCFVLMPFGRKPDSTGLSVDFDSVYRLVIRAAIEDAGLDPVRADEEMAGGIIHKPMFERLILCDYAVADLTTANANVFYELGVRHAMRPYTTVLVSAEGSRAPFDVAMERRLSYALDSSGVPVNVTADRQALTDHLRAAKEAKTDSPIFQLLSDLPVPQIDRLKTDVFRDQVEYSEQLKRRLSSARDAGVEAVRQVEQDLVPIRDVETGVLVDLFLSYRAVGAWQDMIRLVEGMPRPVASTIMVQEQLGLALNRLGRSQEAERVLQDVLERHGPSSEILGILGRIYKDQWTAARERGDSLAAAGFLDRAIDAYRHGYDVDQRVVYPGINALTLMELRDPPDPRRTALRGAVEYAVTMRLASGLADYWDHASNLELAVLADDRSSAFDAAAHALASVREPWEPRSTADNLRLIRTVREARGSSPAWARDIERALVQASQAEEAVRDDAPPRL